VPRDREHILLTRLQPGQEIALTATASKGRVAAHVRLLRDRVRGVVWAGRAEAVATKRQKIVANDAGLDESDLRTALNHFDCIDAQRMYRVAEDDTAYNFVVESESGMTAREVDGRVLKLERVSLLTT
jgi:hypothetical protein